MEHLFEGVCAKCKIPFAQVEAIQFNGAWHYNAIKRHGYMVCIRCADVLDREIEDVTIRIIKKWQDACC